MPRIVDPGPLCQAGRGVSLLLALLLAVFVLGPPWNVLVVAGAALLEVVEVVWGLRLARRRVRVGVETLIGREATVVRALRPEGQVLLDGERWSARCAEGAEPGERVLVRAIEGLTLEVERAAATP
jgi:membrane-bound serine protease (ClpP class)